MEVGLNRRFARGRARESGVVDERAVRAGDARDAAGVAPARDAVEPLVLGRRLDVGDAPGAPALGEGAEQAQAHRGLAGVRRGAGDEDAVRRRAVARPDVRREVRRPGRVEGQGGHGALLS